MKCKNCETLVANQLSTKDLEEKKNWRDIRWMHCFFEHHNPPIYTGDKENEMSEMSKESKKE